MNEFLTYIQQKWGRGEEYTSHNISWNLSPKINAVQRSDDMEAKRLLFMAFVEEANKDEAIEKAVKLHKEQAKKTKIIYDEIKQSLDNSHKVIVCFGRLEDKNYLGLVANKIMGDYNKPVIILRESNKSTWTGSLRSPFPVSELINQSKLAKCQGHSTACGITVKKSSLQSLVEWFDNLDIDTDPAKKVAATLTPNQINLPLCHACSDDMLLWGGSESSGIPQPKFYMCFETAPNMVKVFVKRTKTVKISIGQTSIMKFMAKQEDVDLLQNKKCQIECIVTLEVNEYNGVESPQAKIEAWEIKEIEDKGKSWMDWF